MEKYPPETHHLKMGIEKGRLYSKQSPKMRGLFVKLYTKIRCPKV